MKIGKIIVEPNTGRLEFEQVELTPAELPDIEKLIIALKDLQVATMNASARPSPVQVRRTEDE